MQLKEIRVLWLVGTASVNNLFNHLPLLQQNYFEDWTVGKGIHDYLTIL